MGAAHEAARGQIVYITEHGNRVAGIVPVELAAILDRLTTDELDQLAAAAELARLTSAAGLMGDLADRAGVLASGAGPGADVLREQPKPEASASYQVTWSEKASKHLRLPGVFRDREDHCRVLYTVDDDRRTIWIEDVRHRSKVHGDH